MKIFIFIMLILMSILSTEILGSIQYDPESKLCQRHKIYCAIMTLQPGASDYAMEVSDYVYKYSKKYDSDPLVTIAIVMQESSLLLNKNRTVDGVKIEEVCDPECRLVGTMEKFVSDVSLYQFHTRTIISQHIDLNRLLNDLEYATEQHFKLMKKKKKICSHLGWLSWTCYHSATEKFRKEYELKVMEHYNKIKKFSQKAD